MLHSQQEMAGGLALFNLTGVTRHFVFSSGDVPELDKNAAYWVYDFFAQKSCLLDGGQDCPESPAKALLSLQW